MATSKRPHNPAKSKLSGAKTSKAITSKRPVKSKPKKIHHRVKSKVKRVSTSRIEKKDVKSRARADYLSTLPKGRVRRLISRLHPKRVLRYWFSRKGLVMGLKISGIGIVASFLFMAGLFAFYRKDLPNTIADLQACVSGQTTEYFDSTGETLLWSSKGNVECTPVAFEDINPNLVEAVLAAEDQDFYEHGGYKASSVVRAAVNNFRGGSLQGGSTITQQYVKNAVLKTNEQLVSRKVKELILAIQLEGSFSKQEILNAYLNVASFGSVYDGIEAASRGYFEKPASELTLDESALLAAAIPAPSYYWRNPEVHATRKDFVLRQMLDQGRINQEQFDAAVEVDTLAKVSNTRDQFEGIIAPHFVLETENRLEEEFGEGVRKLGFKVITTLDLNAQQYAQESVDAAIPALESRGMDNAAAVAIDVKTGKVLAQVGSRDFNYPEFGQINTATTPRDPGSAFKIFDYAAVIENTTNWGPGSTFYDYKTEFSPGFTPQNYNGRHNGPVTMRFSLGQSYNIPAIKAMYIAGIENTHKLAYDMGLRTPVNCGGFCGLSSAIGSGVELRLDEMTNAYATLGRGGEYQPVSYYQTIFDADGEVLREWQPAPEEVLDPQTAFLMNDMLSDNSVRFAKTSFVTPGVVSGVKTGTTNDFKNNTLFAYSKSVAFGAWQGHHDVTRSFGESRTTSVKSTMYKTFMSQYHANIPEEGRNAFSQPEGIKTVRLNRASGYQSNTGTADIYPSWYVPKKQDLTKTAEIDTVTGKRATECTPARALQTVSGGSILAELPDSDPSFDIWMRPIRSALGDVVGGEIPAEEDDLHKCDDVKPTIAFSNAPQNCNNSCTISAKVTAGTHPVGNVQFIVDGQVLDGGSIQIAGPGVVDFAYDSKLEGAKTVIVQIVDNALYEAQASTTITFSQPDPITLNSINVLAGGNALNVNWNRKSSGLSLVYGGACSGQSSPSLTSSATSDVINSTSLPSGDCSARISGSGSQSNSVNFTIP